MARWPRKEMLGSNKIWPNSGGWIFKKIIVQKHAFVYKIIVFAAAAANNQERVRICKSLHKRAETWFARIHVGG